MDCGSPEVRIWLTSFGRLRVQNIPSKKRLFFKRNFIYLRSRKPYLFSYTMTEPDPISYPTPVASPITATLRSPSSSSLHNQSSDTTVKRLTVTSSSSSASSINSVANSVSGSGSNGSAGTPTIPRNRRSKPTVPYTTLAYIGIVYLSIMLIILYLYPRFTQSVLAITGGLTLLLVRYYFFRSDDGFTAVPMGRGMRNIFRSRRSAKPTKEKTS